jgi:hypothetical protein
MVTMAKTDERLVRIRDPLFVIELSLEIIKQRTSAEKIKLDLQRINTAMTKIEQIIQ